MTNPIAGSQLPPLKLKKQMIDPSYLLKFWCVLTHPYKTDFYGERCLPLINIFLDHILSNMSLSTPLPLIEVVQPAVMSHV